MIDENPFAPRVVTCLAHRRERATHICTDLNCPHSPILCPFCLNDPRIRGIHGHDSYIRPLWEGVQWLTSLIRSQSKSIELIYERTIGSRQCEVIKFNLQKRSLLNEQLQSRLESLKMQLQLQIDLLIKQFQKQLQIQKLQYHRRLDEYHRNFYHNLQILKRESTQLLEYQHSLKYYNNTNSFTLKLITQTQRKSQDWIMTQKRVLQRVSFILENPSFVNAAMNIFTKANKSNLFILPSWQGDKKDSYEIQRDMKNFVRSILNNWISIPQINDLQTGRNIQYISNKYVSYPINA